MTIGVSVWQPIQIVVWAGSCFAVPLDQIHKLFNLLLFTPNDVYRKRDATMCFPDVPQLHHKLFHLRSGSRISSIFWEFGFTVITPSVHNVSSTDSSLKNVDIVLGPGVPNICFCKSIWLDNFEIDKSTGQPVPVPAWGAAHVGDCTEITMILDSMDAQKHSWPRSRSMASKEFASFVRPRLSSTTLIMHGFAILTALSPHHISTNSSRSAEILCAGLTMLSDKVDLTSCWFNVQADNCPKEVKNNCTLRLLAFWVALHRVAGAEMNFFV